MAEPIQCFRCGTSLEVLTLPISRRDLCPQCSSAVHVCRMCINYSRQVLGQCLEDDAEEVLDKENTNYCEWFKPSANAFDPAEGGQQARAEAELASLFGETSATTTPTDDATAEADKLFD